MNFFWWSIRKTNLPSCENCTADGNAAAARPSSPGLPPLHALQLRSTATGWHWPRGFGGGFLWCGSESLRKSLRKWVLDAELPVKSRRLRQWQSEGIAKLVGWLTLKRVIFPSECLVCFAFFEGCIWGTNLLLVKSGFRSGHWPLGNPW